MTKDKTAVERVRKYHNRLKERGFVRVTVWVLARDAELIREVARDLKSLQDCSCIQEYLCCDGTKGSRDH